MSKVKFNYADVPSVMLKRKRIIHSFIESIFLTEGIKLHNLNYIFCSDEYLLGINNDFLKHDYYTDIITFDLSSKETREGVIGEVYVSTDRVKDNAKNNSTNFENECMRVLFHGALHLCGYRDKKKSEITIMREKEDYYLRLFGK